MGSKYNALHTILFISAIGASTAFASHGSHSTGASGAASAMGGTGTANYTTETEALFRNPSLLSTRASETFKPRLEISSAFAKHNSQGAQDTTTGTLPAYTSSKDGLSVLPNIAAGMKITNELGVGLGIVGLGGSSVDYSGTGKLSDQKSQQLMYRMTPAASYKIIENLSVGAGLVVGYSSISLNANGSTRPSKSAVGFGGIFGVSYTPVTNLRFGASYVTRTKFKFDSLYDLSTMNPLAAATGTLNDVAFQEPDELGIGVSYECSDLTVALDYRRIGWKTAMGYSDLGWSDQGVVALGAQYKMDKLALRMGFTYAKSPFGDYAGADGDQAQTFQTVSVIKGGVDIANYSGFTAITELEFDGGVGYQVTDALSADLALVFTPSKTVTASGTMGAGTVPYIVSSKANEWAVVAGVNYQL